MSAKLPLRIQFATHTTYGIAKSIMIIMLSLLIFACSESMDNPDPEDRVGAVDLRNVDQATLYGLATTDSDVDVRCAAIRHLTDQQALRTILFTEPTGLEKLREQLKRDYVELQVINGKADPEVLKAMDEGRAVILDTFGMMTIDIGYAIRINEIGLATVETVSDPQILEAFVNETPEFWSSSIKEAASKRLAALTDE